MPTDNTLKLGTKRKNLYLRVVKGHFATNCMFFKKMSWLNNQKT